MSESLLLCVRPSFLEGIARIFDVGNTLNEYNSCLTPEQADFLALYSDWRAIGLDYVCALEDAQKEMTADLAG